MREKKVITELKGRDTCSSIQYCPVPSPLRSSNGTSMESASKGLTVRHKDTVVRCTDTYKIANILNYRKRNQLPKEARGAGNETASVSQSVNAYLLGRCSLDSVDHTLIEKGRDKSVLHLGRAWTEMKS